MSNWVISANALTKRYGDFTAVDGIHFSVPPGVCFGLLGPNGAGKTTTIQMITCRFPPDGGTLTVLGMDARALPGQIRARLGIVPQENNLDETLTLLQNLELYGRYFGISGAEARHRASELLEFMHLESKKDELVRALSGGMKRRAVIARALLNRPDLVVLDEPTTGLDPQARVLLWDRLRDLKAQGTTLLLTTHYMDEAERLCDELVIMHEGSIHDHGTPKQMILRHAGVWVAEVELPHDTDPEVITAAAAQHVQRWELAGRILHLYSEDDQALLSFLKTAAVDRYQLRPANLEDVFLLRTGREIRE